MSDAKILVEMPEWRWDKLREDEKAAEKWEAFQKELADYVAFPEISPMDRVGDAGFLKPFLKMNTQQMASFLLKWRNA